MLNAEKLPNIPKRSCDVHTTTFLKFVELFFSIMYKRVEPVTSNNNTGEQQ